MPVKAGTIDKKLLTDTLYKRRVPISSMIHFTKHAVEKFAILKKHDFFVSEKDVTRVVTEPDAINYRLRHPLIIAQKSFDKNHVLRVIYKKEEYGIKIIITFYPGRKNQYEKK